MRDYWAIACVAAIFLVYQAFTLFGGSGTVGDLVVREQARVAAKVEDLGRMIDAGRLENVRLVRRYADELRTVRPEVAKAAGELGREATTRGRHFTNLQKRVAAIDVAPRGEDGATRALDEIVRIEAAADPVVFNDSLIDVLNVLADLSGDRLSRVEGDVGGAVAVQGAGSHLVGNPVYGRWQQDSSGSSFWVWYGAYALMGPGFWRPGLYRHDDWYRRRGWSYYGDVGRNYYGTRGDQQRWSDARRRNPDVRQTTRRSPRSVSRLSTYGRSDARGATQTVRRASSYSGYGSSVRGMASGGRRGK